MYRWYLRSGGAYRKGQRLHGKRCNRTAIEWAPAYRCLRSTQPAPREIRTWHAICDSAASWFRSSPCLVRGRYGQFLDQELPDMERDSEQRRDSPNDGRRKPKDLRRFRCVGHYQDLLLKGAGDKFCRHFMCE